MGKLNSVPEDLKKKLPGKLKSSFVAGAMALVFLIIGYQTALFVHSAAVTRIAADRDCPDTVFVSVDKSGTLDGVSVVRRSSGAKSPVAENVRKAVPRKKVENFRFNPNTVSGEDLQRLGFSEKQAASIVNYRLKGGRFRRPADFARSYVVADSVFRRLEKYIDIPLLDLNTADSAAFDALPGIGGWFAKSMLQYRERLGGYSYPEQLMEIRNFDRGKFEGLCDLVCVREATHPEYRLWELPEEQLKSHPYIGASAHAVTVFRKTFPQSEWTVENLRRNGIISQENAERLSRCRIAAPPL